MKKKFLGYHLIRDFFVFLLCICVVFAGQPEIQSMAEATAAEAPAAEAPAAEAPAAETPAAEAPAAEAPAAETPVAEASEAETPAPQETELFSKGYARIKGSAKLYKEAKKTDVIGCFAGNDIVYVVRRKSVDNGNKDWMRVAFSARDAQGELTAVTGWLQAGSVNPLSDEEQDATAARLKKQAGCLVWSGDANLPLAILDFSFSDTTEATTPPVTEIPAPEIPTAEESVLDIPVPEIPEIEEPESVTSETDAPAVEAPVTESPATEETVTEAPVTESPAAEAPVPESPATEETVTEAPVPESPAEETPAAESPAAETPATEMMGTESSAAEEPETEKSAAEEPVIETPAIESPAADAPATEEPVTEAPASQAYTSVIPAPKVPAADTINVYASADILAEVLDVIDSGDPVVIAEEDGLTAEFVKIKYENEMKSGYITQADALLLTNFTYALPDDIALPEVEMPVPIPEESEDGCGCFNAFGDRLCGADCTCACHGVDGSSEGENSSSLILEQKTLTADTTDGMTVTMQGLLPVNATLSVTVVSVETAVQYVGAEATIVFAYDIKIMVPDGESGALYEYQPEQPVTVTVAPRALPNVGENAATQTGVEVSHVKVNENTGEATVDAVSAQTYDDGAVAFSANSFSIYIGTVVTNTNEVWLTAGTGYQFYSDAACATVIESQQYSISQATTIYIKPDAGYMVWSVSNVGTDGSAGTGTITAGTDAVAYEYSVAFPTPDTNAVNQLITVSCTTANTLYYNGTAFFTDSACTEGNEIKNAENTAIATMPDLISWMTGSLLVYMKAEYAVSDTQVVNSSTYNLELRRASGYTRYLLNVASGGSLSLDNITVDGGAIWTGTTDSVLQRGTTNSGLSAANAMLYVNGSLSVSSGVRLQNNVNTSSDGGAVYLSSSGSMVMSGGTITGNATTSTSSSCGAGIYSIAPGSGNGYGLVLSGGLINGNYCAISHANYGGAVRLYNGASMHMTGGTIRNNSSPSGSGGGISIHSSGRLVMSGGTLSQNKAGAAGGGIYSFSAENSPNSVTIAGGLITGNSAGTYGGGGIYLSQTGSGACTISGGTISANSTTTNGGAVYAGNNTVVMSGGSITADNKAATAGSNGFYFDTGSAAGRLIISGNPQISAPISTDSTMRIYINGPLSGQIMLKPSAYTSTTAFASGNCSSLTVNGTTLANYTLTGTDAQAFTITGGTSGVNYYAALNSTNNQLVVGIAEPTLALTSTLTSVYKGSSCTVTATVTNGTISDTIAWTVINQKSSATVLSGSTNASTTLTIGADETSSSVTVVATLTSGTTTINQMLSITVLTPPSFTVTIPEQINVSQREGSFLITAQGQGYTSAPTLTVTLAEGSYQSAGYRVLSSNTNQIHYYLYQDADHNIAITNTYTTAAVFGGAKEFNQSTSVYYSIDPTVYAGTYTDTLTFTVSVSGGT